MRDTLPCMLDDEAETFIVKLGGKLAAKFYTPRWFHPVFPFAKDKEAHNLLWASLFLIFPYIIGHVE